LIRISTSRNQQLSRRANCLGSSQYIKRHQRSGGATGPQLFAHDALWLVPAFPAIASAKIS
jgi:hypothetical protein